MQLFVVFAVCLGFAQVKAQCESTLTTVSGRHAPSGTLCKAQLIFQDEFDSFDTSKWTYESTNSPYNDELEYYTDKCCANSFVENGILNIKPSLTVDTSGGLSPVTSARLISRDSFNFKYGYVEISAKTPTGDWLWPALWMMPTDSVYGDWPRSGEIDIVETRGNVDYTVGGQEFGTKYLDSTLHWGPDSDHNQNSRTHFSNINASSPYNTGFHKYGLEWTPEYIRWIIDDTVLGTIAPPEGGFWEFGELSNSGYENIWGDSKMAPFDQEFYFILNVAIGGTYFPDSAQGPYEKPWAEGSSSARDEFWNNRDLWLPSWNLDNSNDAALQIDYIRVYAV